MVFSPFLPCFSRGTYAQGAWAPAAALAGEPKEIAFVLADFFGGDRNPEGRRSRKPSLRPQGAQVFARLPCPREEGARKGENIMTEEIKPDSREGKRRFSRDPGANRL